MQTTIKSLHKKGFSNTYIARTLGVSRNTVSKVIRSEERGEEQLVKKPHPSMHKGRALPEASGHT
jgi:IS30 family transposase